MAVDALASATPLSSSVDLGAVKFLDMFLGLHGGMLGETCVLAILAGFAILLATGTIQATIPVSIVATCYILTLLYTRDPYVALMECMAGGLLFGAVFMATDYVTSPFTTKGKLFYGIFIGLVTFLIRHFASMNEGMSFAILWATSWCPGSTPGAIRCRWATRKPKKQKPKRKGVLTDGEQPDSGKAERLQGTGACRSLCWWSSAWCAAPCWRSSMT